MPDREAWVRSRQVIDLVARDRPELSDALDERVRSGLLDGLVRCRAAAAKGQPEALLRSPSGPQPIADGFDKPWEVPAQAWVREGSHIYGGLSRFALMMDTFETRCPGSGYSHLVVKGLSFEAKGLCAFLELTVGAGRPAELARSNGRKPPSAAEWTKWADAYRDKNPLLPDVDRVILPEARSAFPNNQVTQKLVRETFGGQKPGPRMP